MKKRTLIILGVVAVAACALVIYPVLHHKSKAVEVKTQAAAVGSIESWFSGTGTVEAGRTKQYFGPAQLTVKTLAVEAGDHVTKGETLATFDTADFENALAQAKLQLSSAQLQLEDTQATKDSCASQLADVKAKIAALNASPTAAAQASLQALESQETQLEAQQVSDDKIKELQNSVQLAQLAVNSAQDKLDTAGTGIVADFDGVVTSLSIAEGAMVTAAQPSIVVSDTSSFKVSVPLGKYDIEKVTPGQKATVTFGTHTYSAEVSSVDAAAAAASSLTGTSASVNCTVRITNPSSLLKINASADVDILTGSRQNVLLVPVEAVETDKNEQNYVFVLDNGVIRKVDVTLGISSDTNCEITAGLKAGQKVVLNPASNVADGIKAVEASQS